MIWAEVLKFIKDNEAVLALLGLAFVVTMPETPPAPFDRVPLIVWWWRWFHEGMRTFVSFRTPSSTQSVTYRQETPLATTVQTSETKTDTPVPPKESVAPNAGETK